MASALLTSVSRDLQRMADAVQDYGDGGAARRTSRRRTAPQCRDNRVHRRVHGAI